MEVLAEVRIRGATDKPRYLVSYMPPGQRLVQAPVYAQGPGLAQVQVYPSNVPEMQVELQPYPQGQGLVQGGRTPTKPTTQQYAPPSNYPTQQYAPQPGYPTQQYAPPPSNPSQQYAPQPGYPTQQYAPQPGHPTQQYAPPPSNMLHNLVTPPNNMLPRPTTYRIFRRHNRYWYSVR